MTERGQLALFGLGSAVLGLMRRRIGERSLPEISEHADQPRRRDHHERPILFEVEVALRIGHVRVRRWDDRLRVHPEQEAYAIAKDAYVHAYPLVLTHTTLMKLSNFAEPVAGDAYGPPNQFHHVRALADPNGRVVVRTNVDTLYSAATLDLKAEPQVLSVPASERYFMLPMFS